MQSESASDSKQNVDASDVVAKLAAGIFGVDTADLHPNLAPGDLATWDSLNHLRLVTAVEAEFSIRLTMRQVRNISCLNDFVQLAIGKDLIK
jgi:acyl carrier protein